MQSGFVCNLVVTWYVCLTGNQGIIQTKMEVSVRFWVPNLGLNPKYDKVTI